MLDQKEIASRLKLARVKRGYRSARAFSKQNNLAESTYAQHESGKRKLNTTTLLSYSDKLSVNPGWILTGQEPILLDNKNLDLENNIERYIIANAPIISVILKMLVPAIINKQIINHGDLNNIVRTTYTETGQYDFDIQIITDTLNRLIKLLESDKLLDNNSRV